MEWKHLLRHWKDTLNCFVYNKVQGKQSVERWKKMSKKWQEAALGSGGRRTGIGAARGPTYLEAQERGRKRGVRRAQNDRNRRR